MVSIRVLMGRVDPRTHLFKWVQTGHRPIFKRVFNPIRPILFQKELSIKNTSKLNDLF